MVEDRPRRFFLPPSSALRLKIPPSVIPTPDQRDLCGVKGTPHDILAGARKRHKLHKTERHANGTATCETRNTAQSLQQLAPYFVTGAVCVRARRTVVRFVNHSAGVSSVWSESHRWRVSSLPAVGGEKKRRRCSSAIRLDSD